jgi:ubiquinone/menaquinone biosynthesis C-methylase UbiE
MKPCLTRTHDAEVYLAENRYDEPKEIFRVLADIAEQRLSRASPSAAILDVGCAAGEFIYYLRSRFPTANLVGIDVVTDLVEKAKKMVPGATFLLADVQENSSIAESSQDAIFMCGVLSIFDSFGTIIENLIRWCKPGGSVFVFGLFNPNPADIWVQYRIPGKHDDGHREVGWNVFSEVSIKVYIEQLNPDYTCRFTPFQMPFPLSQHPTDPARTWTIDTKEMGRIFVNGLAQLCPLQILEISKK